MKKSSAPLIGIPCRHEISSGYGNKAINSQQDAYLNALVMAGGIPFLIPLNLDAPAFRALYEMADGILLTGGGDIDPTFYNQAPQTELLAVQADRDLLEITLARWAAAEGKPMFAICRGSQVLVVAGGGTLCQDIPSQMPDATLHNYIYDAEGALPNDYLAHEVTLTAGCRLAEILQSDQVWTNSLHHQAIQNVQDPMMITGYSSDGIAEVVELPDHPFYCGVQWHPELLTEQEATQRLFRAFVVACETAGQ
ncbi:MAG: gamma-glutamyl-gamma-aminobutyrate hydrolase family protein [Chloroflexota bacterium]